MTTDAAPASAEPTPPGEPEILFTTPVPPEAPEVATPPVAVAAPVVPATSPAPLEPPQRQAALNPVDSYDQEALALIRNVRAQQATRPPGERPDSPEAAQSKRDEIAIKAYQNAERAAEEERRILAGGAPTPVPVPAAPTAAATPEPPSTPVPAPAPVAVAPVIPPALPADADSPVAKNIKLHIEDETEAAVISQAGFLVREAQRQGQKLSYFDALDKAKAAVLGSLQQVLPQAPAPVEITPPTGPTSTELAEQAEAALTESEELTINRDVDAAVAKSREYRQLMKQASEAAKAEAEYAGHVHAEEKRAFQAESDQAYKAFPELAVQGSDMLDAYLAKYRELKSLNHPDASRPLTIAKLVAGEFVIAGKNPVGNSAPPAPPIPPPVAPVVQPVATVPVPPVASTPLATPPRPMPPPIGRGNTASPAPASSGWEQAIEAVTNAQDYASTTDAFLKAQGRRRRF